MMTGEVLYEGKSKLVCRGEDESTYIIKFKNTATAFNGLKKEELEDKGKLNAEISNLLFGYLTKNGIKTHLVKVIDDTTVVVKKAEIILVEVIIRNVAAGSFSKKYGVDEGTKLNNTVVEFSYKSDALGDPLINDSHITALGIATQAELEQLKVMALEINDLMSALFLKAGIKLIDFKLEFGRCEGEILLCDEISPDSCRFWDAKTNEKMDKDRFRRDLGNVMDGYRDVLNRLKKVL
ncbi:MAG: phosphoribosylaminoimidazolesuccinocarboxamide synthase [Clostridia bacterium]|nr:phosphoribosylaminoimidazolesuccinocarboxamide synthase [Clostridia bacterium]